MKYIPLSLAALLLLCLAPMPYGYYQLVRFVSMVVFGVMAVRSWNEEGAASVGNNFWFACGVVPTSSENCAWTNDVEYC